LQRTASSERREAERCAWTALASSRLLDSAHAAMREV
jgi:hypothetical protein